MIGAKIILDSISPQGKRLTTFELRYPKFIHGELMTHRQFSRNASSSRAIPTTKLLEEVRSGTLRAGPVFWGKNQPGMQAAVELAGHELEAVQTFWAAAAVDAADRAEQMLGYGCHKQVVNRILEPFSHINVVVTATEYANFFGLRLDAAAQPEIRELALQMFHLKQNNDPKRLIPGEWHLPYIDERDAEILDLADVQKVSVARCARVSYRSFETGKASTFEEDLALYTRLVGSQPIHASPAEHQATPDTFFTNPPTGWQNQKEHGNFIGWRQYRKMLPGESCAPLPKEYQ